MEVRKDMTEKELKYFTIKCIENKLEENETKATFRKRRAAFEDYRQSLNANDVNLCLVGTYSAGKSTFINALIGKRILPESKL